MALQNLSASTGAFPYFWRLYLKSAQGVQILEALPDGKAALWNKAQSPPFCGDAFKYLIEKGAGSRIAFIGHSAGIGVFYGGGGASEFFSKHI